MNILMMTNTYKPILGGLEKSIEIFTNELRAAGHDVVIVAPEFQGMETEEGVIRIPAIQNFNGSDFSVQLPIPGILEEALGTFRPDVVHTHHPFLIGDTALRVASRFNIPLVFTHHTLYEQNVHYVPGNEEALQRFVIELSTGFANMADHVIAPSESVMNLIKERGVTTPVSVVPTGIYVEKFAKGAREDFRKKLNIPAEAFVVGHLGRLAPEKNLDFLADAVAQFLKDNDAHFLLAGKGPSEENVKKIFEAAGAGERLHLAGVVKGQDLIDCYHAMDVFAFSSQSETQGLVITEAMAAGLPVVAVDAPGVREVVADKVNGRLLQKEDKDEFVEALTWCKTLSAAEFIAMKKASLETADKFSMKNSLEKILKVYLSLTVQGFMRRHNEEDGAWSRTSRLFHAQWELVKNLAKAAGQMMVPAGETAEAVTVKNTENSI